MRLKHWTERSLYCAAISSIKEKNLKNEIETHISSNRSSCTLYDQREESQEWDWNRPIKAAPTPSQPAIKEKNLKNEIETHNWKYGCAGFR